MMKAAILNFAIQVLPFRWRRDFAYFNAHRLKRWERRTIHVETWLPAWGFVDAEKLKDLQERRATPNAVPLAWLAAPGQRGQPSRPPGTKKWSALQRSKFVFDAGWKPVLRRLVTDQIADVHSS
jgi:hypothetical protein